MQELDIKKTSLIRPV